MKLRLLTFLILAAGCGQSMPDPAAIYSLQDLNEAIVNNDGYQHVEQRLGKGSEKIAEFTKGDDGKIEMYKTYVGDRKDANRDYWTDRVSKNFKQ